MLASILLGILFGFTLSIPPGPLALAFMKKSVSAQYKAALLIALGAAVMDVVYNLLAAFASSALVVWLSGLFLQNRWLSLLFQAICVAILLVLGIRYLRDKHDAKAERTIVERERAQERRAEKIGHGAPFLLGTLIAFTNLATPTFLPSMIAVISYLQAERILDRTISSNLLYSVGFGAGTMIWFTAILRFIMKHHAKLTPAFITSIFKFAGGAFIFFAVLLAYNIVTTSNLHTLF
jgi:threonine/homoserine/homoserine lactone efflux protein